MKAADVMVSPVITLGPDATVQEVADILLRNRISAVPVLSQQGKILGIVSEGDLLRRVESGTQRHRSWWLELLTTKFTLRDEYVKSHSRKVTDIMTSDVLTVSPGMPLGDIASVLEKNGIKRVPVVTDGKLVGIVSRANLLQAIATIGKTIKTQGAVSDAALREKVVDQLEFGTIGPAGASQCFILLMHGSGKGQWRLNIFFKQESARAVCRRLQSSGEDRPRCRGS